MFFTTYFFIQYSGYLPILTCTDIINLFLLYKVFHFMNKPKFIGPLNFQHFHYYNVVMKVVLVACLFYLLNIFIHSFFFYLFMSISNSSGVELQGPKMCIYSTLQDSSCFICIRFLYLLCK